MCFPKFSVIEVPAFARDPGHIIHPVALMLLLLLLLMLMMMMMMVVMMIVYVYLPSVMLSVSAVHRGVE